MNVRNGSAAAGGDRQKSADCVEKVQLGFQGIKYASEIETHALSRYLRTRSGSVQSRCFQPLMFEQFGKPTLFNSIGQQRAVASGCSLITTARCHKLGTGDSYLDRWRR